MDLKKEHFNSILKILFDTKEYYLKLKDIHEKVKDEYPEITIREALQIIDKLVKDGLVTAEDIKITSQTVGKPDVISYRTDYYISYEGRELVKKGGYEKYKKFNYEKWTFWIQVVVGTLIALITVLLAIGKS